MREILFRGKDENGNWHYGDLSLTHCYGPHIITEIYHVDGAEFNVYDHTIIPETVGQFTGLTDKNGKNIFEGDICNDRYGFVGVVEYFDEFGGFVVKHEYKDRIVSIQLDVNRNKFEVIGNLFENPEMRNLFRK